jgi:DNA-binding HxlR family transcriptional regulator
LIATDEQPSIFWQDEILQVMYWMRGEGFGEKIAIPQLKKFLDAGEEVLTANLSQLEKHGLVNSDFSDIYELTETGIKEGGRRFADEFDGMLKQGHYECNDPDCDCNDPTSNAECKHFAPHAH